MLFPDRALLQRWSVEQLSCADGRVLARTFMNFCLLLFIVTLPYLGISEIFDLKIESVPIGVNNTHCSTVSVH